MAATRRLTAILAADVAGYSRLMGEDEEGTHERLKTIRLQIVDARVEEYLGRVVKNTGDGLLVEFSSVVDAIRCAVVIQRAIVDRNAGLPDERKLEFRIGINLGDVIVEDDDIFGDGVNVAARLEELAEPGGICVSGIVRDQVQDKLSYAFDDMGERAVKNIPRLLHAYSLSAAAIAALPGLPAAGNDVRPSAPPASRRRAPAAAGLSADPFVGRQREIEVLTRAFEQARAGQGRIVLLAGEPGIGKTRTAQYLADHAARHGAVVLWGRCHEEAGAPPYWPWVQVVRASLRNADAEMLAEFGAAASDIADIVPEIRDRVSGLERSARLDDPAQARFRMFDSVRLFLAALCRRRTHVLVLDDLHWADAPSLRLLEFLAPEMSESRLLLLGSYRGTELSRQHPLSNTLGGLARVPTFTRINLPGLSAEEVREFVTASTRREPPAGFAETLFDQTEGNPLFLREIVRFLEQRGVLSTEQEHAGLGIRIPEGIREVIGRRLNLLSPGCNEVLALASVIGRDFAADLLLRAATPLDREMLIESIDEAILAHVIEETNPGRYQFTHNLIRITLYDELRTTQRRQFHRAVGRAIQFLYRANLDPFLPELARHFQLAGNDDDLDQAIAYAVSAGERADALLAFEDAVEFFQAALDSMEQRTEVDPAEQCRVSLLLGEAVRKSGDFHKAQKVLRDAARRAEALGLFHIQAQAALAYEHATWRVERLADLPPEQLLAEALRHVPEDVTRLRIELMAGLSRALLHAGAVSEARAQLMTTVALARQLGDKRLLAVTLNYQFDFPWVPAETEEFLALATEALEAADAADQDNVELIVLARTRRLVFLLELARVEEVQREIVALARAARPLRQPIHFVVINGFNAMLALMRGDLENCERLIKSLQQLPVMRASQLAFLSVQIFELFREQGKLQPLLPLVLHFLGQNSAEGTWGPGLALLWVALDRLDQARAEFEKAAANDFSELPRDGRWTTCVAYMTEVCAALGDTARAEVLYHLLLPYTGRALLLGGGVVFAGAAERYLGLLCTTMRRWQDAERHFDEAVYLNARLGAHLPLAHTQCDYAAMLLTRGSAGDQKRATALLHSSNDTARRLGLKAVADRVETMLLRLHPKTALPAPADELTPREREVLGLMAIGRSNGDIALALSISLNTVTTHVRNILAKTGCANRTEAAAYALRRGTPR